MNFFLYVILKQILNNSLILNKYWKNRIICKKIWNIFFEIFKYNLWDKNVNLIWIKNDLSIIFRSSIVRLLINFKTIWIWICTGSIIKFKNFDLQINIIYLKIKFLNFISYCEYTNLTYVKGGVIRLLINISGCLLIFVIDCYVLKIYDILYQKYLTCER